MTRDGDPAPPPASARPSYPVVLIPPRLLAALEAQLELPAFTQPPPSAEDFPAELPTGKTVASAFLGLFGLKQQADELLAPARLEARRKYEAALERHQQAWAAFEAEEAAKCTPQKTAAHRQHQVAALLESSQPESVTESRARMGAAEAHLYERLAFHFPKLVKRRRLLRAAGDYHPDYLLVDPAHRLRMDIELDEPYTLRLKSPIHFVVWDADKGKHLSLDAQRDDAFLAAGWPVVRFSERQAIQDPDGCARVVADVMAQLTGQPVPTSLADTRPVSAEPRWTRQDANMMAEEDTRVALLAGVKRVIEAPIPKEAKPEKVFKPSEHQQRIYDFLLNGDGHGLVVAVAGSGKSTTLLESVKVIKAKTPEARIVLLAFNTSIRTELKTKLADAGLTDVETYTLNGFGNEVIRASKGRGVKIQHNKERGMLRRAADELGLADQSKDRFNQAVNLYGKFQSYAALDPHDLDDFQRLATVYNVKDADPLQPVVARALELAVEDFKQSGRYTLDEQNYLPVKLKLPIQTYDFVFVDECQDLTQTQLELVIRAAGDKGRLLFVGDPRQAIMGFRGADNESVQNIREMERAPTQLPLTVCYRCPTEHLKLARKLMTEIQAASGAKKGEIHELKWDEAFDYVQEGDLLFARTKNLVDRVILELFARGLTLDYAPPKQKRQEDDQGDEDLGSSSARVAAVTGRLKAAAVNFKPEQAPRRKPTLGKTDKPLETLLDWTLGKLHQQARDWDGEGLTAYVDALTRPDERMGVKVSSAHQSKGLEADRVFVMGYPLFGVPRQSQQPWEYEQELNLKYVALTRAKETLHLVGEPEYR